MRIMKLKEQLLEMGLSEESAKKVAEEIIDGNYIPKSRFNEINEENKTLKKSISERDKQLEDLKKSDGDNAALKQQIEDLQKQNAEQKKNHEAELNQLKLDNAIEAALTAAGAKNGKTVRALLDITKVKLDGDGKLVGFDEQLEAVRKSDDYLFAEKQTTPTFKGFQPGASSDAKPKADFSAMTYSEMTAYMSAHPEAKI